jgi:hypothetical protein
MTPELREKTRIMAGAIRMAARYIESRPRDLTPHQAVEELMAIARWVELQPYDGDRE